VRTVRRRLPVIGSLLRPDQTVHESAGFSIVRRG